MCTVWSYLTKPNVALYVCVCICIYMYAWLCHICIEIHFAFLLPGCCAILFRCPNVLDALTVSAAPVCIIDSYSSQHQQCLYCPLRFQRASTMSKTTLNLQSGLSYISFVYSCFSPVKIFIFTSYKIFFFILLLYIQPNHLFSFLPGIVGLNFSP